MADRDGNMERWQMYGMRELDSRFAALDADRRRYMAGTLRSQGMVLFQLRALCGL